jgi:hypothetical protein
MANTYTCTTGKNGLIYVFLIDKNLKKRRVQNKFVNKCSKKQVPKCEKPCKGKRVSKKTKPPCRKQRSVFVDKEDLTSYCESRVNKGPYKVEQRQQIIEKANKLLKKQIKTQSTKKITVKFI